MQMNVSNKLQVILEYNGIKRKELKNILNLRTKSVLNKLEKAILT